MRESDVLSRARLAFGQEADFVLWRNSTGVAETEGRTFRYGLCVGSSDLIGLAPGGLFLAVECKGSSGGLREEQVRFLELVLERGGVACEVGPDDNEQEIIRGIRAGRRRFF
jgi:hypothetical protein